MYIAWLVLGQGSASPWQDTSALRLRLPCTPECPQGSAEHTHSSAQRRQEQWAARPPLDGQLWGSEPRGGHGRDHVGCTPIATAPEAVTGATCSMGCRNGLAASSLPGPLETIQVGNYIPKGSDTMEANGGEIISANSSAVN